MPRGRLLCANGVPGVCVPTVPKNIRLGRKRTEHPAAHLGRGLGITHMIVAVSSGGLELRGLLAQVASGNRRAFGELHQRTHSKMLRTALQILRDREEAEDALQDAYLKIWRGASTYRATGTHSPISWMAKIVRNGAIDKYRARHPSGDALPEDLRDSRHDPEQSAIASQRDREVSRLIGQLDDKKRMIVIGAYVEGLSYRALSDQLGMPLNTVRTRLRRGLRDLREMGSAAMELAGDVAVASTGQ